MLLKNDITLQESNLDAILSLNPCVFPFPVSVWQHFGSTHIFATLQIYCPQTYFVFDLCEAEGGGWVDGGPSKRRNKCLRKTDSPQQS